MHFLITHHEPVKSKSYHSSLCTCPRRPSEILRSITNEKGDTTRGYSLVRPYPRERLYPDGVLQIRNVLCWAYARPAFTLTPYIKITRRVNCTPRYTSVRCERKTDGSSVSKNVAAADQIDKVSSFSRDGIDIQHMGAATQLLTVFIVTRYNNLPT